MAAMSNYIVQLNQLLPQVVQLFEKIDGLNSDLTTDQDRMISKMRATELLGELLKKHVYQTASDSTVDQLYPR